MRQLPELKIPQTNFLGYAQAIDQKRQRTKEQNYLESTRAQAAEEHAVDRNYLMEQRAAKGEEDKRVRESTAIANAFKGGSAEQRTQIYKSMGGIGGITFVGEDVSIEYPDSIITGNSAAVQEMAENVAKNPEYMDDPRTAKWFASQGGSIKRKEAKAPTTRTVQEGRTNVNQEWNPTTKTWERVGGGPKDKPTTKDKMSVTQAKDKYVKIVGLIDKAKNSGGLDQIMLAALPASAKDLLLTADRSEYIGVLEQYADSLKDEYNLPFKSSATAPQTIPDGFKEMTFDPKKGLF